MLHAFCNNPAVSWSPERLCIWYGIRIDRAYRIVDELARWNDAHDWAVPRTTATRRVVQERWAATAACPAADPTGHRARRDASFVSEDV